MSDSVFSISGAETTFVDSPATAVSAKEASWISGITEDAASGYLGGSNMLKLAVGHPDFVKRFHGLLDEMANEQVKVMPYTDLEEFAASILGADKVFGTEPVMDAWNQHPLSESRLLVPFSSKEKLQQCAEENSRGADWRLVWVNGFSLTQQKEIRGCDVGKQPCFNPNYSIYLEPKKFPWITQPIKPGYRLLDFNGRFADMARCHQDEAIGVLGSDFKRAEEQAVAEACFSIYMVGNKNECLLPDWFHSGLLRAHGRYTTVGYFSERGLAVSCVQYYQFQDHRVVLCRSF